MTAHRPPVIANTAQAISQVYPILHFDDEIGAVTLLNIMLGRSGLKTLKFVDGQEALEMILNQPLSLVIGDISMPSPNALEMLPIIRQHAPTAGLPFMILSARGDSDTITRAMELGAHEYVTKPLLAHNMVDTVSRMILDFSVPYLISRGLMANPNVLYW